MVNVKQDSRESVRTCDGRGDVQGRGGDEGGVGVSEEVDDLDEDGEENPESEELLDRKDEEGENNRSPEGPKDTAMGSVPEVLMNIFFREFGARVALWSSGSDSVSVLECARLCLHVVCKVRRQTLDVEGNVTRSSYSSRHQHSIRIACCIKCDLNYNLTLALRKTLRDMFLRRTKA